MSLPEAPDIALLFSLLEYYSTLHCPDAVERYVEAALARIGELDWNHLESVADCLKSLGFRAKAMEIYRNISQNSESACLSLGALYKESGDLEASLRYYRMSQKASADHYFSLAELESQLGRVDSALEMMRKGLQCESPIAASIVREGHIIQRNWFLCSDMGGELPGVTCEDCYCHMPQVLIAEMLSCQQRFTEAEIVYKTVAEMYSKERPLQLNAAFAWKRLADCNLFCLKDPSKAELYYEHAISLLASSGSSGCFLMDYYYEIQAGETQDRRSSGKQAELYLAFARYYHRHSHLKAAEICFLRGVEVLKLRKAAERS